MKDELPVSKLKGRSLDERFKAHRQSYARLQAIADVMEESIAEGCSADEAEERAIQQIQKLGQELLTDWARGAQEQSLRVAQQQHPQGSKHLKKK